MCKMREKNELEIVESEVKEESGSYMALGTLIGFVVAQGKKGDFKIVVRPS